MSRLQSEAKPILEPLITNTKSRISFGEQKIIATWATMIVMTLEFADPKTIAITQAERDAFRQTPRPLDCWRMWVGSYTAKKTPTLFHHRGIAIILDNEIPRNGVPVAMNTQITAFAVGRLVIVAASGLALSPLLKGEITIAPCVGLKEIRPRRWPWVTMPTLVLSESDFFKIVPHMHNSMGCGPS
jgi:hypothetical protein